MASKSKCAVIIPVESQVRELDAKLLLACVAAEHGYAAVLGSRGPLNEHIAKLPRGVFLAKGLRSIAKRMFKILRGLGHEIVAWDEEALVRFPREDYYRRRLAPEALEHVSHIFAWGEDDAQVVRECPGLPETPIHVTGNPRIDLLRPEVRGYFDPEVAELRREYGDFILVNTNFGFVNAFATSLNLLQPPEEPGGEPVLGDNTKGMDPEFARGLAEHKAGLFEHFRKMVPAIASAFPDRTIVVRPHPAEDHAAWLEAAAAHQNVRVTNERSVIPWLIASDALIHNGCTTAVEATVLGKPAIAFRPVARKGFDFDFPNSLCREAHDVEELLAGVKDALAGVLEEHMRDVGRAILQRHIASLDGALAADRMMDALSSAGYGDRKLRRPSIRQYVKARRKLSKRIEEKRAAAAVPGNRHTKAYHDHRFPGTSVDDLHERIRRFGEQLGRFEQLKVRQLANHVFRIES